MTEKPTRAPIPLEARNGLKNGRGTIAMARTQDPNSATAQFFINVVDNNMLNAENSPDGNGYAVFGKVVEGMDVVDKIRAVKTTRKSSHSDVPAEPITIKKATLEK
jgi:peptidyl-prolyl cis-trans isomerase A (cyclophilin A)